MKVYLQVNNTGMPLDYDHFNAAYGFREMGFEIVEFENYETLKKSELNDVIVGYSGPIEIRLHDFDLSIPDVDYPESISKYLGRRIWKSTINTINNNPDLWNVFVKPVRRKTFKGRVVRSTADLIGCGSTNADQEIYVSELLNFVSEYRVFVRYGEIIDVRHYAGDWSVFPDASIIKNCVNEYKEGINTYAIDFGVTDKGTTNLIEVNVSGAIGAYGLDPIMYAKFMSARWAELTGTEDKCDF